MVATIHFTHAGSGSVTRHSGEKRTHYAYFKIFLKFSHIQQITDPRPGFILVDSFVKTATVTRRELLWPDGRADVIDRLLNLVSCLLEAGAFSGDNNDALMEIATGILDYVRGVDDIHCSGPPTGLFAAINAHVLFTQQYQNDHDDVEEDDDGGGDDGGSEVDSS